MSSYSFSHLLCPIDEEMEKADRWDDLAAMEWARTYPFANAVVSCSKDAVMFPMCQLFSVWPCTFPLRGTVCFHNLLRWCCDYFDWRALAETMVPHSKAWSIMAMLLCLWPLEHLLLSIGSAPRCHLWDIQATWRSHVYTVQLAASFDFWPSEHTILGD